MLPLAFRLLSAELASIHIDNALGAEPTTASQSTTPVARQMMAGYKACKYCPEAVYDEDAEFRAHYQSPWHIHNQSLSIKGREAITEEEFNKIDEGSSSSDSDFWEEAESDKDEIDHEDDKVNPVDPMVKFTSTSASWEMHRVLLCERSKLEYRSTLINSGMVQEFISGQRNWALLLIKSGRVFAGIYDLHKEAFVKTKSFKRYTERKKQGGSQMLRDKSGKVAKSAGSQLRRHNEQELIKDTVGLLREWTSDLAGCQLIFWNRNFFSQLALFQGALARGDARLRTLPFETFKPGEEEAQRCLRKLLPRSTTILGGSKTKGREGLVL